MLLTESIGCQIKRCLFSSCQSGLFQRPLPPKGIWSIANALGSWHPSTLYIAEDSPGFHHRTWKSQIGTDQEASCLLARFYLREGLGTLWEKITPSLTQLWVLCSANNDTWVADRHGCSNTSQSSTLGGGFQHMRLWEYFTVVPNRNNEKNKMLTLQSSLLRRTPWEFMRNEDSWEYCKLFCGVLAGHRFTLFCWILSRWDE